MDAYLLEALNTLRGVKHDMEDVLTPTEIAIEQDVEFLSQLQEAVVRFVVGALDLQERAYGQDDGAFDGEIEGLVCFFEAMQVRIADRVRALGR